MSLIRLVARPLLATGFIASGVQRLKNIADTGEQLAPAIKRVGSVVPLASNFEGRERTVALALGGTQVGAGILLALGKFPRLAALVLASSAALTTWVEFVSSEPQDQKISDRVGKALKNVSLIGGALLAAVDTDGKPSLAWRAENVVKDSKKALNKQAKLAQKQLQHGEQALKDSLGRS